MRHPAPALDLDAFVARHLQLLATERQAEVAQVQQLWATRPADELAARGVLLRRLAVADLEPGLGGALLAVLRPSRGGPLPAHRFAPGDVVALGAADARPGAEGAPTGVVARVRADELAVALDDEEQELPPLVQLARIAPDVTFRRMQAALQELGRPRKAADARLVDLCFLRREPGPPAALPAPPDAPFDAALDASQLAAVAHALAAPELALIHGPPGTGKTTAVVEVIRRAVAAGGRVLACAPSNVAVDNLAERLVAAGLRIVRIGQPVRVLPAVVEHTLAVQVAAAPEQRLLRDVRRDLGEQQRRLQRAPRSERRAQRDELRRLRREQRQLEQAIVQGLLDTAQVVLATATGAADQSLGDRTFDLVVLDEAAQALEAQSWIPLLRGRRAVLAGDHCQLPPTVLSEQAARDGLAVTLFERLMQGPLAAGLGRMLTVQYRMHAAIQAWSSATFYGGALAPAAAVAGHTLPELPGVAATDATRPPLLFLDTAGCGHEESPGDEEGSRDNAGEAAVAVAHVRALLEAGVPARDLGVLTPYNAQVQRLRAALAGHEELEIGTVDALQGREKEAVVVSLVRSNDRGQVGFLAEMRRLNVALTRARRHLCVVGDSATLAAHPDLAALVAHLQEHGEHRSAWGAV